MPDPNCGEETEQEFISRFMGSEEAKSDYPDQDQRAAVAHSKWDEQCGDGGSDKKIRVTKGS